jgi:hypothetical protein
MKTNEENVQSEVEATLNVVSGIARVEPSPDLKQKIMDRVAKADPQVIPFYRRAGFAVAAAVLILVLNLLTVVYYLKQEPASTSAAPTDRLAEIQAAYSLDESVY